MTTQRLVKNPNTKTTYLAEEVKTEIINKTQYKNITSEDTLKWFRRLGGNEYADRGYFYCGYLIYKLISTSPDRQNKTIRQFKFIEDKRFK
tara:strand:- start:560 stop:832 length:273 start_codon:yes stop_codon:yes gene_type:complete